MDKEKYRKIKEELMPVKVEVYFDGKWKSKDDWDLHKFRDEINILVRRFGFEPVLTSVGGNFI